MTKGTLESDRTLLTVRDVAQRLQLSVALIYSMVSDGSLPGLRVGKGRGSIRFREADVQQYLDDCRLIGKRRIGRAHLLLRRPKQQLKHLKVGKEAK